MYLSLLLVLVALSVLFISIWFLISAVGLWFVIDRFAVAPEELYLELKFGDRYKEYKLKVRRWIWIESLNTDSKIRHWSFINNQVLSFTNIEKGVVVITTPVNEEIGEQKQI